MPRGQARTAQIVVRLREIESEFIRRAASASGLSLAEWMRQRLLAAAEDDIGEPLEPESDDA